MKITGLGIDRLYNRKDTERILLSQFEEKPTKRERKYIKKLSETLEAAYKMGLSDGRQGRPKQGAPDIPQTAGTELSASLNAIYTAYCAGYQIGGSLGTGQ